MSVTYLIDPEERIVYVTVEGHSTFGEWEAALRGVLADPAYRKGFDFLTDRRGQVGAPEPEFPRRALGFLVGHTPEMGRYRWAGVSNAEATFQAVRMFSILAEEVDIHIRAFRDYDEARRWLSSGGAAAPAVA